MQKHWSLKCIQSRNLYISKLWNFKVVICLFFNVLIKCLVFFKAEFCAENDGEIYFWKKQGLEKLEPKVEN